MTTTPSREDWEEQLSDLFDGLWLDGSIDYSTQKTFDTPETKVRIKDFIRNLLQNHNNALVAEIEELKEQRNEIYKMTVEHFSNEQEKVSFFKKFVDIIRIIQEK